MCPVSQIQKVQTDSFIVYGENADSSQSSGDKKYLFRCKTTLIHGLDLNRYLDSQPMGLKQSSLTTGQSPEEVTASVLVSTGFRLQSQVATANVTQLPKATRHSGRLVHGD
jgi:hypothetical protein